MGGMMLRKSMIWTIGLGVIAVFGWAEEGDLFEPKPSNVELQALQPPVSTLSEPASDTVAETPPTPVCAPVCAPACEAPVATPRCVRCLPDDLQAAYNGCAQVAVDRNCRCLPEA